MVRCLSIWPNYLSHYVCNEYWNCSMDCTKTTWNKPFCICHGHQSLTGTVLHNDIYFELSDNQILPSIKVHKQHQQTMQSGKLSQTNVSSLRLTIFYSFRMRLHLRINRILLQWQRIFKEWEVFIDQHFGR